MRDSKKGFYAFIYCIGLSKGLYACIYWKKWRFGRVTPMPDILTHSQTTEYRATQLLSSIQFKLSHAILPQQLYQKSCTGFKALKEEHLNHREACEFPSCCPSHLILGHFPSSNQNSSSSRSSTSPRQTIKPLQSEHVNCYLLCVLRMTSSN